MEKSFVMIKPDGVQRKLIGEIINRFEHKGLKMIAAKMLVIPKEMAEKHYEMHKGKDFFNDLVEFITSGPVVAMVWQGENSIAVIRKLVGATNPIDANAGTIRGDYGMTTRFNMIHASDCTESAVKEIGNFFREEEVINYDLLLHPMIYLD